MAASKETVLGIIQSIMDATEPGSVTNRMVATVLEYLAQSLVTGETMDDIVNLENRVDTVENRLDNLGLSEISNAISSLRSDLTAEQTARGNADTSIISRLQTLEDALTSLTNGNLTSAIESINELLAFVAGYSDTDSLSSLLDNLQTSISTLQDNIDNEATARSNADSDLQTAIDNLQDSISTLQDKIGAANGIAPLDESGKVPKANLPAGEREVIMVDVWSDETTESVLDGIESEGKYFYKTDTRMLYCSYVDTNNSLALRLMRISPDAIYIDRGNNIPYVWKNGSMVQIAPRNVPASIFNATVEVPVHGYYVLCDANNTSMSALHVAWREGKAVSGLIISFEIGAGVWKTYQYIGKTVTEINWLNTENWKDFGSLAAGSEPYVIINDLIGPPEVGSYYTLETAVARLIAYQQTSGVTYAKRGLIISYANGENTMETKQFQGEVTDFGVVGLWKDFGGGGSQVETSDTPESGGTEALSTGGAYQNIPVSAVQVESDDQDMLAYQFVNADGDTIGEPFSIPKGGGGSASSKVFSISFQNSPLYAAAGGQFVLRASIRSVTTEGNNETTETIERVDIIDRDTAQVLYTNKNVNRASSASSVDYSFSFDLSAFFTSPSNRRLQVIAYDTAGARATRTVNVVAVDVTVESTQTLNYTPASVVYITDNIKSLPMYKFPNNQGGEGITAKVEILVDNQWKTLGTAVIRDTYSHNITVNPANVAGETLTHGSYLIRIQGTDNASNVRGNTIYSTLMVIDPESDVPVVAIRYNDSGNGSIRLFDVATMEISAYSRQDTETEVAVLENGNTITSVMISRHAVATVRRQINGVTDGATLLYKAVSGSVESGTITLTVNGSIIDAELTEGAIFNFDFSYRTNSESGNHAIESGQNNAYKITLNGANFSSNGFKSFLGANALAIKENVTGSLNYAPMASNSVESSGMALLFQFASTNIQEEDAHLMDCYDPNSGAGFYVTGKVVGIYCKSGNHPVVERRYPENEKVTVGIVVEPGTKYVERSGTRYSLIKLFLNGDEAGCLGYVPGGSNLLQPNNIKFYGNHGDLYLYYLIGWAQLVEWQQQFYNYLVKLTDTDVMITEFDFEDVYEGNTDNGPSVNKVLSRGMAVVIEQPFNGSNVAALDNTTSTKEETFITLTYRNPSAPWRDFIAYNVRRRNQGTTSAKRPVKNARYNFRHKKNAAPYTVDGVQHTGCYMKLLHTREEIVEMGYDGELWDDASRLIAYNKIRVGESTIPVDVVSLKVDYSDSSNANDCGACNLVNATFRALGDQYMTPAQRFFDGTYAIGDVRLSGLQLNHSTANHPVALYRDADGTGSALQFYAKGNWKEDKGEQVALGFKNTPGYNLGCVNYGEFVEYIGASNEDLDDIEQRFKADNSVDTDKLYLLSLYCGSSYRFMRYQDGEWTDTTGSMRQVNGSWVITGDVLNPVDGYELLAYTGMDWFKGVSSIADMMAPTQASASWVQKLVDSGDVSASTFPAWTQFFECMIDDDQLQIDLAMGRKVPYNLYAFLRFCDSCDYDNVNDFRDVWKENLRWFANPRPLFSYNGFTDYTGACDQQAKNMQPMFFLDEGQSVVNGVYSDSRRNVTFEGYDPALIMYPNKVYDADGLLGKDNEGDATFDPEVDPNKPSDVATGYSNPYAGWGSILWRNCYYQPTVYDTAGAEISMQTVIAAMRSSQATVDGRTLVPFSPEGAKFFFIEKICKAWQKTVSSFDGENKYIRFTATSDAVYFYALHGLRLTAIPNFIDKRFRIRDGFYKTGLFFSSVFSARINAESNASITIKAAKTGYFGLGIDSSGDLKESVYLEAGESHVFTGFLRGDGTSIEGTLLYIYQCDRIAEIDFDLVSLSDTANFSVFRMAQKITIGTTGHTTMSIGSYGALSNVELGDMPFLTHLLIQDTVITRVDASKCPRLEQLLADGSRLQTLLLAETSPVATLQLPDTITDLRLKNLPNLTYGGLSGQSGLTLSGLQNLRRLYIDGCEMLNSARLLHDALTAGASISHIRMAGIHVTFGSSALQRLMDSGVTGLDADGNSMSEDGRCSGLSGTWLLADYVDVSLLAVYRQYFPLLTIHNAQYTMIEMDDAETNGYDGNIRNLDNNTKDGIEDGYVPSGHITRLRGLLHLYKGMYDAGTGKMVLQQLNDNYMSQLLDGTEIDLTDMAGEGYDLFLGVPHYWYKGINDHLHQKKYLAISTEESEPLSSASQVRRGTLLSVRLQFGASLALADYNVGDVFDDANLRSSDVNNVYRCNVSGMRQVRWPSVNSNTYGALFLDKDGKVMSKVETYITHSLSDFVMGEYIFVDVPDAAQELVFTAPRGWEDREYIAVDSMETEAIEPDWVEHDFCLIGCYKASVDTVMRVRSISGQIPKGGTGTSRTSTYWEYDNNGDLTVGLPPSGTSLNYTVKDWQNLAKCRGAGFQVVDYEMHKDIAILWMAVHGRRNSQAVNGNGVGSTGSGSTDNIGVAGESIAGNYRSKVFGLEDWWGCACEVMDGVALNITSYDAYYKAGSTVPAGSTADYIWHIRMPDGSYRKSQGINGDSEICRVRWGRYCDVVPSRAISNGSYNTYFCDSFQVPGSTGRCVVRSGYNGSANYGFVYVNANSDASYSNASNGSRLAFRGEYEIVE